jgi:hypothetical protein
VTEPKVLIKISLDQRARIRDNLESPQGDKKYESEEEQGEDKVNELKKDNVIAMKDPPLAVHDHLCVFEKF